MKLGQLPILLGKKHYLLRRYPRQNGGSLLFAGCYFPAFFPRTMRALRALAAEHDTACVFDCCGKPLADLKHEADAQRVISRINRQLQRLQARELITVCPNCYVYLQKRLGIPVCTVYEKLADWGLPRTEPPQGHLFIPCPDRARRQLLGQIGRLTAVAGLQPVKAVPCCGLGGGGVYDRDSQRKLARDTHSQVNGMLYTYCASCAGQFQRQGLTQVSHMLALLLDTGEAPDIAHSFANRWQFKREPI